MSYYIYKKKYSIGQKNQKVMRFHPTILHLFTKGEKTDMRTAAVRLEFLLMSRGKFQIYYYRSASGRVLHASYVLPPCYKFPFLKENQLEIGPCRTIPEARGQGIYSKVLQAITTDPIYADAEFYIFAHECNSSSIRGIEKSGFVPCGKVEKLGAGRYDWI